MQNNIIRFCQLCREIKIDTKQLECDHIICELCLETQKLYTLEKCFLCCCIQWMSKENIS